MVAEKLTGLLPSIRDQFPMLAKWNHFNCGGMAPLSHEVGAELLRVPTAVVNEGPLRLLAHDESFLGYETARATVAEFIGADPDEIAFTTQFSTAVNIVVEGLSWREGDEILVTEQEHPALLIPVANIARRRGCEIKRIPVDNDPAVMLDRFAKALSPRTRLVAMSHVTTDSGTVLPAAEMTRLAHDNGSLVFWDGAHSLGQMPVDVRSLDCDFYAMVGYKWVLGPYPSAALYIRSDRLDDVDVTWTGSNATKSGSVTMGVDDLAWIDGARRFEYGGQPYSYATAMAAGMRSVDRLSISAVQAHQAALYAYALAGFDAIEGVEVCSPRPPLPTTGIITPRLTNMSGVDVSAALLKRWNMVQRAALWGTAVRISLAAYTEQQDVDLVIEAFRTLAEEQRA